MKINLALSKSMAGGGGGDLWEICKIAGPRCAHRREDKLTLEGIGDLVREESKSLL